MANIIMYKTTYCPYCVKAKELFKRKGFDNVQEIDVTTSDELRAEMLQKSGGRKTVPQIFINGTHIGGCDDAYALDKEGKLDAMLNA
jgi:glutaredoxin 3